MIFDPNGDPVVRWSAWLGLLLRWPRFYFVQFVLKFRYPDVQHLLAQIGLPISLRCFLLERYIEFLEFRNRCVWFVHTGVGWFGDAKSPNDKDERSPSPQALRSGQGVDGDSLQRKVRGPE